MKRTLSTLAIALFATLFLANIASAQSMAKEKSLYQRLGGYDAIAAVTDDFLGRLIGDQTFARFFGGASDDSKAKLRQHVVDLLCYATGGPCAYTGRDMKTAHKGLGISNNDWNVAVKHLTASLEKINVPAKEKNDLFTILGPLKEQIVEKG